MCTHSLERADIRTGQDKERKMAREERPRSTHILDRKEVGTGQDPERK